MKKCLKKDKNGLLSKLPGKCWDNW